ncbi:MAG TPA: tetratricopeptide repeat protein [Candidatus Paraprevotella stercorigallinarum]|nr:tetratricopeptide repeat protein [Candidatus Paraprevotella stercorigallinarum]
MLMRKVLFLMLLLLPLCSMAQINTDRVMLMGRNALYYEDYVLSIQRFNMVISAKPYLAEPYFFRGLAKFYLEDYSGAEADCAEAIERNPFQPDYYRLRGLCRINQENYEGAVADYRKLLSIEPKEEGGLHNMTLCYLQLKDYDKAMETVNTMIRYWPKNARNHVIKAQACFEKKDTVAAMVCLDDALKINPYEGNAWQMKAMVYAKEEKYEEAEDALDKVIQQKPREADNYINRALVRYHRMNLRGAMDDYDAALEFDSTSYIGHFNRGLLRAQVGDDNRAIEDFNYVLKVEPDNMIALFNRALMLDNTGDYRGAIRDITKVINEYPDFIVGYQYRASIRRKIGDANGAERDEFVVLKAQLECRYGGNKPAKDHKTRKKSDRSMENYNKLVEADEESTAPQYESAYRGKVQNRKAMLRPEPLYMLTYYPKAQEFQREQYVPELEKLNRSGMLARKLELANYEEVLTDRQVTDHSAALARYTTKLAASPENASLYFARALEEWTLQDYDAALEDVDRAIQLDSAMTLAYCLRIQIRMKNLELDASGDRLEIVPGKEKQGRLDADSRRVVCNTILDDCDRVMAVHPDFVIYLYNMGNVYFAMNDYVMAVEKYTQAIERDPQFAAAYYNRGVVRLMQNERDAGIKDLSRAGELGLYSAYNLIKRYSKEAQEKEQ